MGASWGKMANPVANSAEYLHSVRRTLVTPEQLCQNDPESGFARRGIEQEVAAKRRSMTGSLPEGREAQKQWGRISLAEEIKLPTDRLTQRIAP
jgi:hypothetical protein